MRKPNVWIEIIDQLRNSKSEDLRSNLPEIIKIQNYYTSW